MTKDELSKVNTSLCVLFLSFKDVAQLVRQSLLQAALVFESRNLSTDPFKVNGI